MVLTWFFLWRLVNLSGVILFWLINLMIRISFWLYQSSIKLNPWCSAFTSTLDYQNINGFFIFNPLLHSWSTKPRGETKEWLDFLSCIEFNFLVQNLRNDWTHKQTYIRRASLAFMTYDPLYRNVSRVILSKLLFVTKV